MWLICKYLYNHNDEKQLTKNYDKTLLGIRGEWWETYELNPHYSQKIIIYKIEKSKTNSKGMSFRKEI